MTRNESPGLLELWIARTLLVGSLALFVGVVGYVLRQRLDQGRGFPSYSVFSSERDGLGEAAHLLQTLGWKAVAITRPVYQSGARGLLIMAGFNEDTLEEGEGLNVLRWVEQGNTLLLAGGESTALHRAIDLLILPTSDNREIVAVDLNGSCPYTKGMDWLTVEGRSLVLTKKGIPLWWIGRQPGAVVVGHGKGRVIVVADASLLTHRGLARDDNILFLVNLAEWHAKDRLIYFDEFHHGIQSAGGFWGYLDHHGQQLTLVPIGLVLLVGFWHLAVRLGPAIATPRTSALDAVDYASALARLYQQTQARRLLGRTLARDFLLKLTRHLQLPRTALLAEILAAWQNRHPAGKSDSLLPLLRGLGLLRSGEINDHELLSWARQLDRFEVEVMHAA